MRLSEKLGTKAGVVGSLFSMHLERSWGESNKFEPAICIDCGGAGGGGAARARVWWFTCVVWATPRRKDNTCPAIMMTPRRTEPPEPY